MEILYYPSKDDFMWNDEICKILPYTDGQGIDIGCGGRSIRPDIKRVDIDPQKEPDICCSGDEIPVPDESFDFVVAQHVLEHFENQDKALKEWLRLLKKGGYLLIIHPDINFTGAQLPPDKNPDLLAHPHNRHYHERYFTEFLSWINNRTQYGFNLMNLGEAAPSWSFFLVLRKHKD